MSEPRILSGKDVSAAVLQRLKSEIAELDARGIQPGLAVILVGDDPASQVYVRSKRTTCENIGIRSKASILPASTTQRELDDLIDQYNQDPEIHGILCQLPLPDHLDEDAVLNRISPLKDVDCFHPENVGRLMVGDPRFLPCTPHGCMQILRHYGIETAGKHCVIIGRSNIVGKPLAAMLMNKDTGSNMGGNATVSVCHSRTADLPAISRQADILIAAIGRPNFVTADMVAEGAVVLDVGINRVADETAKKGYRLVGDVDYAAVAPRCSAITPVPGGVGPMTIGMLMDNTVRSARLHMS